MSPSPQWQLDRRWQEAQPRCPTCKRLRHHAKAPDWFTAKERRRLARRGKVSIVRRARNRLTVPDATHRHLPWNGRSHTDVICHDPFHTVAPPTPPRGRIGHNPDLAAQKMALKRSLQGKDRR